MSDAWSNVPSFGVWNWNGIVMRDIYSILQMTIFGVNAAIKFVFINTNSESLSLIVD
jgi:hypothetical protein